MRTCIALFLAMALSLGTSYAACAQDFIISGPHKATPDEVRVATAALNKCEDLRINYYRTARVSGTPYVEFLQTCVDKALVGSQIHVFISATVSLPDASLHETARQAQNVCLQWTSRRVYSNPYEAYDDLNRCLLLEILGLQ